MVRALPMNETVTIEDVEVTLVDANHCPGAAMIHFFDPATGNRVLHVGDFRASAWLVEGDALADLLKRGPIDHLYLDTTYNSPKHCFPPQDQVLDALARIVQTELEREPNTVFLVGSYSIGKEKAIEAVARAAASPALVSSRKARLVKMCQRDPDLYTEEDGPHVRVRVAGPGMSAGHEGLADLHLATRGKFASAVAFRPTGWMFTPSQKAQGCVILLQTCRTASAPPLPLSPDACA
jgi:DNA cross-link repair 1A protein